MDGGERLNEIAQPGPVQMGRGPRGGNCATRGHLRRNVASGGLHRLCLLPNMVVMPARGAVTLFHVRGIRIGIDYSWFFVLFLIIFVLSDSYRSVLDRPDGDALPYVLAVASALAFFGSILLHELGHAFVALRRGIGISDITLWMFGGVARMTKDSDSPGTEFQVAAAGPLVTLVLTIGFIAAGVVADGFDEVWHAMPF